MNVYRSFPDTEIANILPYTDLLEILLHKHGSRLYFNSCPPEDLQNCIYATHSFSYTAVCIPTWPRVRASPGSTFEFVEFLQPAPLPRVAPLVSHLGHLTLPTHLGKWKERTKQVGSSRLLGTITLSCLQNTNIKYTYQLNIRHWFDSRLN